MTDNLIQQNGEYTNLILGAMKDGQVIKFRVSEDVDTYEPLQGTWGEYRIISVRYNEQDCTMFVSAKNKCTNAKDLMSFFKQFKSGDEIELELKEKPSKFPKPMRLYTVKSVNGKPMNDQKQQPNPSIDVSNLNEEMMNKVKYALEKHKNEENFQYENVKTTMMTNLNCTDEQAHFLFIKWFVVPETKDEIAVKL